MLLHRSVLKRLIQSGDRLEALVAGDWIGTLFPSLSTLGIFEREHDAFRSVRPPRSKPITILNTIPNWSTMPAMWWVTLVPWSCRRCFDCLALGRRLQVTVWQRAGKFEKNQCIGEAFIQLDNLTLTQLTVAWYKLFREKLVESEFYDSS